MKCESKVRVKNKVREKDEDEFLARRNFRLRMPTSVCQKPPSDYIQKIVDFLLYVLEVRIGKSRNGIYAADE
uniref:Uncharacterized protein n=1 Tax=Ditylenchus dipsaci TaxID=166011 RepID=A0A915CK99_9BILA